MNKPLLIITGPTCVGKTDRALAIAAQTPAAIINADVGQMYVPCTIGTAKPPWRTLPVPHYLFDIIDKPGNLTVADYRTQVSALITTIQQEGRLPIIVGGSGFYIQSLFFKVHEHAGSASTNHPWAGKPLAERWQHLASIDPERARQISQTDPYRIDRALAIWHATGQKPSTFQPQWAPVHNRIYTLILQREREQLRQMVAARTKLMLSSGWLAEVDALTPEWRTFLLRKKLIGYPQLIERAGAEVDALAASIAADTMAYAKRQGCFLRRLTSMVSAGYATDVDNVGQFDWADAHGYTSACLPAWVRASVKR